MIRAVTACNQDRPRPVEILHTLLIFVGERQSADADLIYPFVATANPKDFACAW